MGKNDHKYKYSAGKIQVSGGFKKDNMNAFIYGRRKRGKRK